MTQVPTHPRMRQPKPNNNNMKIRTSIVINTEDTDYSLELSEEIPNHTIIVEILDDKERDVLITIPNEHLKELVQALNEHIKIHGL